jgi:hypothetical protein
MTAVENTIQNNLMIKTQILESPTKKLAPIGTIKRTLREDN